ncbi:hypothetical protein AB0C12_34145 [Actinoplanes sp. NPDC048967]|uniref:hypothetical protein n=1 Tax=Actinoplanes sp. NPDC048967 TaxID=3155269 RepID=UPI0033CEF628
MDRCEECRFAYATVSTADLPPRWLARDFDALSPPRWSRTVVYNWPSAESQTILCLGRHTVHEVEHHLMDLTG